MNLSEVLHTESPTEVILRIFDTFTSSDEHWEYFCRHLVALGYDFMCNMLRRLLSTKMKDMMYRDESVREILFFWHKLGLHRLFIDKMHIQTHKEAICSNDEDSGLLHPKLSKFKGILNGIPQKVNEQMVEQKWVMMNRLNSIRLMNWERFDFSLFLKREHNNHQNKLRLDSKGYCYESNSNWKSLRTFGDLEYFMFDGFETERSLVEIVNVMDVQREAYEDEANRTYRNIWLRWDEENARWECDSLQRELMVELRPFVSYRMTVAGSVDLSDIEDFICGWKGADVWKRFKPFVTDFIKLLN